MRVEHNVKENKAAEFKIQLHLCNDMFSQLWHGPNACARRTGAAARVESALPEQGEACKQARVPCAVSQVFERMHTHESI
jgi:hypothetical protein